jgi:hypothetical protein
VTGRQLKPLIGALFLHDKALFLRYRGLMIIRPTSSFWYFSYGSSLAAGGSRSI